MGLRPGGFWRWRRFTKARATPLGSCFGGSRTTQTAPSSGSSLVAYVRGVSRVALAMLIVASPYCLSAAARLAISLTPKGRWLPYCKQNVS
jgi:hypothetical protein